MYAYYVFCLLMHISILLVLSSVFLVFIGVQAQNYASFYCCSNIQLSISVRIIICRIMLLLEWKSVYSCYNYASFYCCSNIQLPIAGRIMLLLECDKGIANKVHYLGTPGAR
jgi:hypothetical protein